MISRLTEPSAPEKRVLSALSPTEWMTRGDIAAVLNKRLLTPKEINALRILAERNVIDMQVIERGDKVYSARYLAK